MKHNNINPLEAAGRNDGMTVPEGYFADFAQRMASQLPEPEMPAAPAVRRTLWQQMRPYVYLAAMFAGIWCMLQMFDMIGSGAGRAGIDSNPTLTAAIGNDTFFNDYMASDMSSDYDIYSDLYADGVTVAELRAE